jgi:hypothetical protein
MSTIYEAHYAKGYTMLYGTEPLTGPLSIPRIIRELIPSSGGIILARENRRTWRKRVSTSLFPQKRKSHIHCTGREPWPA